MNPDHGLSRAAASDTTMPPSSSQLPPGSTLSATHRAIFAVSEKAQHIRGDRRFSADTTNFIAMAGDVAMILAGLMLGFWLRFGSGLIPRTETWWTTGDNSRITFQDYYGLIAAGTVILFFSFFYQHLYRPQNLLRFRRVTRIVFQSAIIWLVAYLLISLTLRFTPPISRLYVVVSFVSTLTTVLTWRFFFHRALRAGPIADSLRQRVLFVGWNSEAARLAEVIHSDPAQPYDVIGCTPPPNGRFQSEPQRNLRIVGQFSELPQVLSTQGVDMVILSDLDTTTEDIVGLTNLCERMLVQFKVIPSYFQILVSGLQLETISGVPILGVEELPLDRIHNRAIKRIVDIIGAIVGLLLSVPVMLVLAVLIRRESPGPIFYRQVRTGRNGKPFQIIKLRSMKLDAEKNGAQWATKDDDRRLRIGSFMREWNLDEVPQFWNVLKGEMSLVGPRPERPELIANFQFDIPHYNARLFSKPGLTGWAQVNGLRGNTDLSERVRYDLYYLENWSLWLDFQIMFMTVVSRKNAY